MSITNRSSPGCYAVGELVHAQVTTEISQFLLIDPPYTVVGVDEDLWVGSSQLLVATLSEQQPFT